MVAKMELYAKLIPMVRQVWRSLESGYFGRGEGLVLSQKNRSGQWKNGQEPLHYEGNIHY